jgi:hypothetical protein
MVSSPRSLATQPKGLFNNRDVSSQKDEGAQGGYDVMRATLGSLARSVHRVQNRLLHPLWGCKLRAGAQQVLGGHAGTWLRDLGC